MIVTFMLTSPVNGLSLPVRRVLYMEPNSVGHLFVTFSTTRHNQTMNLAPLNVFDTNQSNPNRYKSLPDLSVIPNRTSVVLDNNSIVVDYTITAKNNLKGLFEFSIPETCGIYPLVVGLDSSQIDPRVLSFGFVDHGCTIYPSPVKTELSSNMYTTLLLSESSSQTVPEFPLAIPVLLIGVISLIVFYKIKIHLDHRIAVD